MLAGQNRVEWLLQFNSQFGQFAEDDGTQYGAYGYRWRKHHGFDQLSALVTALEKVNNRRAVLQMWDAVYDMGESRKDVPCNTHAYFYNDGNKLDMTVCCRSNDMIWGAYGANVVHFSILQELIASELGVAQGKYYQMSNNFHLYTELGPGAKMLAKLRGGGLEETNPYRYYLTLRHSLLGVGETMAQFIRDCENFVLDSESMHTTFMKNVALPPQEVLPRPQGRGHLRRHHHRTIRLAAGFRAVEFKERTCQRMTPRWGEPTTRSATSRSTGIW